VGYSVSDARGLTCASVDLFRSVLLEGDELRSRGGAAGVQAGIRGFDLRQEKCRACVRVVRQELAGEGGVRAAWTLCPHNSCTVLM
jgi:hypothetical protein